MFNREMNGWMEGREKKYPYVNVNLNFSFLIGYNCSLLEEDWLYTLNDLQKMEGGGTVTQCCHPVAG